MSVQISQVYQFTDDTNFDPRKLQWELTNIAQTINNANAGLLTWDNIKVNTFIVNTPMGISSGGTNSGTALNNNRVMISSGGKIVEQSALTISSPMRTSASGLPTTGSTSLTAEVTGVLPVANGGTNTASVLSNNRIMISASGTIAEQGSIAASRAIVSDVNGLPVAATTTSTEVGFVNGVTSAIQTQLNSKQATLTAGQLVGTATNDAASAGNVGEYVSSNVALTSWTAGSGVYADLTTISLTAGDWDVRASAILFRNSVSYSQPLDFEIGISTTAGNSVTGLSEGLNYIYTEPNALATFTFMPLTVPSYRLSISGTTTVRLKCMTLTYASGSPQIVGGISARRVR